MSEEPSLTIGVVSGEDPYQFHRISSVARLPDGRVVVANRGTNQIRFYDADGTFLFQQGSGGEGPGDWRGPHRVRYAGSGMLTVLDSDLRRIARVTTEGEYVDSERMRSDLIYPSDHRLYGRFLVDSPVAPEDRGALLPALDAMDPEGEPVALVRVTAAGMLWTTEWAAATAAVDWTVHDLTGTPVASVTTPAGFEWHDAGEDWLLGVRTDSLDVQYVHMLELDRRGVAFDPGALERAVEANSLEAPVARAGKGGLEEIVSGMKNLASMQEIYYSDHYTYAPHPDSLFGDYEPEQVIGEGNRFELLRSGSDGWLGRVVREDEDAGCFMTYGAFSLIGMPNGTVLCWGGEEAAVGSGSATGAEKR